MTNLIYEEGFTEMTQSEKSDTRPRDLAVLRVLAAETRGISASRVWVLACPGEPYRSRRDAGMTRTLDRLGRLGLVTGRYQPNGTGRDWRITDAGMAALAANE